jgi:flagellar motility protein MotE (MotC chaperone)
VLGKLVNILGLLSLAVVLAGAGFGGYLYGTGRLSAERLETIGAVLRGEFDDQTGGEDDEVAGDEPEQEQVRARSGDEVREQRKREHLERLEIERALADLGAQRRLLDNAMHEVVQAQERLVADRKSFRSEKTEVREQAYEEGFQRELGIVSTLKPDQAKEHLVRVYRSNPDDAVRLLIALEERQVKRILEKFKSPAELDIQTDLLERIRTQGMEGNATSGTASGAAAP